MLCHPEPHLVVSYALAKREQPLIRCELPPGGGWNILISLMSTLSIVSDSDKLEIPVKCRGFDRRAALSVLQLPAAGVVGDAQSKGEGTDTVLSTLTVKVAGGSSAWTDLVPGTGAVEYQRGRAARCLA